jgi:hypothetical protein
VNITIERPCPVCGWRGIHTNDCQIGELRAALVQAKEALGELSDLVTAVVEGEDIDWDSFTLQPARIALAAADRALGGGK